MKPLKQQLHETEAYTKLMQLTGQLKFLSDFHLEAFSGVVKAPRKAFKLPLKLRIPRF